MATITAAAGGGNWNVGSTWVGGVVPLTTDNVILNNTSGQVTISATAQCVDINFSGYTNTITFNANLTITGNLTRSASVFSYAGTSGIIIGGTTTQSITTANTNWDIPITIGGASPQLSLLDTFKINALLTLSSTTSPIITRNNVFDPTQEIQGFGNVTISGNGTYTGSAAIKITGTATQTLTASGSHQIRNDFTIDKSSGVLTLSGTLNYNTGTLTYVASGGTVNAGSSTLNIGASTILNTNGINWNNVTLNSGTIALTLTSNFNIAGTFSATGLSGALTLTFSGAGLFNPTGDFVTNSSSATGIATITITLPNDISVSTFTYTDNSGSANRRNVTLNGSRNITVNGAVYFGNTRTSTISGTCTIIFAGNSGFTVGGGGVNAGVYSIPVKIDNGLNTCTFAGSPVFTSTTVTYTSGTITGASCFFSACTLNLNAGGQWGTDVTIRGATTLTSNATFGNLTTDTTAVSFTGAFTVNVKGNLAINITTSGASTIAINGSGSQTWTSTSYLSAPLTISKTVGSTLLLSANTYYGTGTLTYISGTIDSTTNSNTLNLTGSPSLNTLGTTWNKVTFSNITITLLSDFTAIGLTNVVAPSVGTALSVAINGVGRKYYANGGMTCNSTSSNGTLSGTAELRFEGIGYWQTVASGNNSTWYQINTVINPTGNFFIDVRFIINKITYSNTNGGTITSANLLIGTNVTNTWSGGITLDTNDLFWNSITYFNHNNTAGSSSTLTSLSNINCNYWIFYNVGTVTNFNINFSFTSGGILNTGTFYVAQRVIVNLPATANFEIDNLYFSNGGAAITGNTQLNNGTVIVKKVLEKQDAFNSSFGTTLIKLANNSSWSNLNAGIFFVMEILGNVTFNGNSYSQATLKYTGNINSPIAKGTLNITSNCALTNMHKLTFNNLVITSGTTMTMNEFFSGLPNKNSIVGASSTTNFNVTFTDNFEKIAKFINVNGVTFTRPQQLLLLTNQPKKSRNIGIRYNNQSPNGVAKNDPSVQNQMTYSVPKYLVGDPNMIKTI